MDRNDVIKLLKVHTEEVKSLQNNYKNFAYADVLYQRTKMYANKYFSSFHYMADLIGIRFTPYITSLTTENEYKISWNEGISKLYSITKAMMDDYSLSPLPTPITKIIEDTSKIDELKLENNGLVTEVNSIKSENIFLKEREKRFKKRLLFIFLLIFLSFILWSFNYVLKWQWLENHTKKIPIYITVQLLIIVSLLQIIINNKAIKFIDASLAIIILLLSLI